MYDDVQVPISRPSRRMWVDVPMTREQFDSQASMWSDRVGLPYVLTGVEWRTDHVMTLTFGPAQQYVTIRTPRPAQQYVTIRTPRLPWWRRCVERVRRAWAELTTTKQGEKDD